MFKGRFHIKRSIISVIPANAGIHGKERNNSDKSPRHSRACGNPLDTIDFDFYEIYHERSTHASNIIELLQNRPVISADTLWLICHSGRSDSGVPESPRVLCFTRGPRYCLRQTGVTGWLFCHSS